MNRLGVLCNGVDGRIDPVRKVPVASGTLFSVSPCLRLVVRRRSNGSRLNLLKLNGRPMPIQLAHNVK
jgi:hypothetical protein